MLKKSKDIVEEVINKRKLSLEGGIFYCLISILERLEKLDKKEQEQDTKNINNKK